MGSYWAYYDARLGRLVVLGPGRERLVHAVADRHRAAAFRGGDGKARRAEDLDDAAGDPRLLAVAARHFPGALRRAHLGAYLRHRPDPRRLHPGDPRAVHRRGACAVRVARAAAAAGRHLRADLARRRARLQQPVPGDRLRHGVRRHALSAGARGPDRREDFGRRAVLQRDVRAAVHSAPDRGAVRAVAGVEARRSARASRSA